jgi:LTXXQ motif family protein
LRAMPSAIATLLIAAVMSSTPVFAQYPGGHAQAGPGANGTRGRAATEDSGNNGAPVLVQLDQLENELKLSPEQREAWNAYADKILGLADDMTRSRFVARTSPRPTDATAIEQLDQVAASERKRLGTIDEIAAAGKALYATLTADQKRIADRKLVLPIRPLATGVVLPGTGGRD